MTDALFQRNAFAFTMSREDAIAYGHVKPTEEERVAMRDRLRVSMREQYAEHTADWEVQQVAGPALAAITDERSRALLDLHSIRSHGWDGAYCDGCEFSGMEAEPGEWPCSTVRLVASWHSIELPKTWREKAPEPPHDIPDDWMPSRLRIRDLFPQAFTTLDPIIFDVSKGSTST